MRLEPGQVAVVTGAASGIGRSIAAACLQRGLRVVLADVEADALDATAARLGHVGHVAPVVTDVTSRHDVDALATRTAEVFGPADLVVANAGVVGPRAAAWEHTWDDWQWVLGVNLLGVANVLAALLPQLLARGAGHVLVTSSTAGLAPLRGGGNAPYQASKYGVVGLVEALREDLATRAPDVGVTMLCPGPVATRIRNATRNRPANLGGPTDAPDPAFEHPRPPLDPDVVATLAVSGIEQGRRYLLPNEEYVAPIAAHLESVIDEVSRPAASPGRKP